MVRTLHFLDGMPLTMMFPIFLAYLDLIEAFLHLGLKYAIVSSAKSLTFDVIPSGMSFI